MPDNKNLLLLSLCLLLSLLLVSSACPSASAATPADTNASSILTPGKNGTALVDQIIGQVNSLGNYKFDASQESYDGKKVLKATGTFYFKPANAMRVEVKDYGSKSGSILVKSPDGNIKGKGGAPMLGIKMSLEPDSRLLRMPNGLSAVECDLGSLLKQFRKRLDSGYKVLIGAEPMKVESLATPAIVLELQKTDDPETPVVARVFIDPVKKLPLQWDMFDKGKFQSRSKFQNYQPNLPLDDSQFKI